MSKLLSQDEIDALLKGVQSGDIDASLKGGDSVVSDLKSFDFTRSDVPVLTKMPGLQAVIENLVRLQKGSLSSVLMRLVKVSLKGVSSLRAGDLTGGIPSGSTASLFRMEPLRGHACLIMENTTVFALIECFFGSRAIRPPKQSRDLTAIEQRILQKIVVHVLGDFDKAWEDVKAIKSEFVGTEYKAERLMIWSATDMIVRIDLQIQIEDFSGGYSLCMPYSMLSPLAEELSLQGRGGESQIDQAWLDTMRNALLDVPVEVTARISGKEISIQEILGLDVGTVISLNASPEDEVPILVEGKDKFMGIPGSSMGNQAIRITRIL